MFSAFALWLSLSLSIYIYIYIYTLEGTTPMGVVPSRVPPVIPNSQTFGDAENERSSSLDVNPWPIVQDRAVGFCRAGVSRIGPP